MSTRCQVKVTTTYPNDDYTQSVTLYHHTDGYPSRMIPLIYEAFQYEDPRNKELKINDEWVKGRAGKIASLLCWADPTVFEPEDSHALHGDIEYYYTIKAESKNKDVVWMVQVFEVPFDCPNEGHMKSIYPPTDIRVLVTVDPKVWESE